MNWYGHLDVMIFCVLFFPISVEYIIWRIGNAVLIRIEDK